MLSSATSSATPAAIPAIEFHDAWCEEPGSMGLRGVSLVIARGEAMMLVGSPSSGTSLVLDLLLGRARPDRGRVRVHGRDPAEVGRLMAYEIGLVRRADGLNERLTARENLCFFAGLYRMYCPPRYLNNLLARVGLGAREALPVLRLTPFERKRLSLARALVHNPVVLALDRPFDDLGAEERTLMEQTLLGLTDDGKAILVTTGVPACAAGFASRVSIFASV